MYSRDIFVSCKELYVMVWATPMQRPAKEFGVSDVALAKTCKKLGVPKPLQTDSTQYETGTSNMF